MYLILQVQRSEARHRSGFRVYSAKREREETIVPMGLIDAVFWGLGSSKLMTWFTDLFHLKLGR